MRTRLIENISETFGVAQSREQFFRSRTDVEKLETLEPREQPKLNIPGESCKTKLFVGFFFDGTRNSYADSKKLRPLDRSPKYNHTNLARLYDCFPGMSVRSLSAHAGARGSFLPPRDTLHPLARP